MESENKMSFEITGSDYKKLEAFRSDHEKCLQDMTGAQYEYSFIPTGIGTFITVTCSCGEKLLLSNETFGGFGVSSPKTSVAETMLKIVRNAEKRPALFLGEKSGKRLQTWLTGMSVYAYNTGHVEEAFFDKISKVAGKWREICTSENLNDEECFDAFYELLHEKEMKRSNDVFTHKPKFIQRNHDKMILLGYDTMLALLERYTLTIKKYIEEDGSITLSLNEIDLIENAKNEEDAKRKLGKAILEYASDYYNDYELYSKSPNRKNQLPYIIKALIIDDPERIGSLLVCKSTVMQKHQKTQMVATPVLEGEDAISAIKAANRKPSDASRKGAKILAEKFEEMIKE